MTYVKRVTYPVDENSSNLEFDLCFYYLYLFSLFLYILVLLVLHADIP